jgi:hypothetical protein
MNAGRQSPFSEVAMATGYAVRAGQHNNNAGVPGWTGHDPWIGAGRAKMDAIVLSNMA